MRVNFFFHKVYFSVELAGNSMTRGLANGEHLDGRSISTHRPRAGHHEPGSGAVETADGPQQLV
jgi:hypothetical protein